MAGYTRQSAASIVAGADILAAPLNAEFNQLLAAFDGSSGHNHQGGTGNGPKLDLTAAVSGVLPIANGGTNASTAAAARTSLFGVSTTTDNTIARYDGTSGSLQSSGITIDDSDNLTTTGKATIKGANYTSFSGDPIATLLGGTTTGTLIEAATNGHIVIALREDGTGDTFSIVSGGGNYSSDTTYDTVIASFAANGDIVLGETLISAYALTLLDDANASAARTTLGLGTIATQNSDAVTITGTVTSSNITITGGSITGITDLAVADGGTGASTASAARTNLGLGSIATQDSSAVTITGGSISGITDLAIADGGTGASTAAAARTNLGLGTIATQASSSVSITGGSISGITDLAIADGGTGASTAAGARTNLGLGTAATTASTDYATAAQGTKADGATQATDLASTTINKGASLVGVHDTDGNFTGTNVETVLAEIYGLLLGVGQTWQDVSASRAALTTYQNTTGKPIMVSLDGFKSTSTQVTASVSVDNATWVKVASSSTQNAEQHFEFSFIVPVGNYYKVDVASTFVAWSELR